MRKVKQQKTEITEEKKAMREEGEIETVPNKNVSSAEILKSLVNGKLTLIYTNTSSTEKFSAGIISGVFDEDFIMQHFTTMGQYDGYIVKKIDDVFRIETESKYVEKLEYLIQHFESRHDPIEDKFHNGALNVINYAKEQKKVISITMFDNEDVELSGYVEKFNDELIWVNVIDLYGEDDGKCIIKLDKITFISCDTEVEIVLRILSSS
jgi:hypothetical protein